MANKNKKSSFIEQIVGKCENVLFDEFLDSKSTLKYITSLKSEITFLENRLKSKSRTDSQIYDIHITCDSSTFVFPHMPSVKLVSNGNYTEIYLCGDVVGRNIQIYAGKLKNMTPATNSHTMKLTTIIESELGTIGPEFLKYHQDYLYRCGHIYHSDLLQEQTNLNCFYKKKEEPARRTAKVIPIKEATG